jgi:hypothetical protein
LKTFAKRHFSQKFQKTFGEVLLVSKDCIIYIISQPIARMKYGREQIIDPELVKKFEGRVLDL